MLGRKFLTAALVAAVAVLASPALSQAAFSVKVTDNFGNLFEGTSSDPNDYYSGPITFTYASGAQLQITLTGTSNTPGVDGTAYISENAVEVKRGAGSLTLPAVVLTIETWSEGFSLSPNHGTLTTGFTANKLLGEADGFSTIGGTKVTGSDVHLDAVTSGATSVDKHNSVTYSNPFTFGNKMTLTLAESSGSDRTQLADIKISSEIVAAPAPAGLIMVVTAVPFFGLIRRRLRQTGAPTTAA